MTLTGQFTDKPTCRQSSCGLVNMRTSQLPYRKLFLNRGKITLYVHAKPNNNTSPNPVSY